MSQRPSRFPDVRRATGRAPSDPDRSGVPSAAYSSSPPSPAFPRRPLRHLLEEPGMAVVRQVRRPLGDVDTLLLTPPEAAAPHLAVSVPATRSAEAEVEREARMLVEIRRLELGRLRGTIPRFVQLCEQHGRVVLVSSALPGRSLPGAFCGPVALAHRRCLEAELVVAGTWLARFQEATQRGTGAVDVLPDDLLQLLDRRGWEVEDGRTAARAVAVRAHAVAELLSRHDAPRTAVHGDFRAEHVLVEQRGELVSGVLDWCRATLRGEPLVDVGRFAVTHAGHLGPRLVVPGAAVLAGRGAHAEQTRRFIKDALVRLGLPETLWYPVAWAATASWLAETDAALSRRRAALVTRLLAGTPHPAVLR